MKYLKLYEGFESNTISNVLSYITKKINKNNSNNFLSTLKKLCDYNDIPLSSISDKDIKYMSAKNALLIDNDYEVSNPTDIYCIKYWFSLDKGLIATTATGNIKMEFNKSLDKVATKFTEDQLDQLNTKSRINNLGILKPVKLSELKTGDKILVCFTSYYRSDRIYVGEIYKDERLPGTALYYIYQDQMEGSSPGNTSNGVVIDNRYSFRVRNDEYAEAGRYSYCLGSVDEELHDHCYMHTFTGDGELRYEDDSNNYEESPWDYNLLYNYNNNVEKWTYKSQVDVFKNVDFAVVVYLDDILTDLIESDNFVSSTKNNRKELKNNALAFNKNIKNENIERYLNNLFDKLNIHTQSAKDDKIFGNFSPFVSTLLLGKNFGMCTYSSNHLIKQIYDISYTINNLMSSDNENDTKYYYKNVKQKFITYRKYAHDFRTNLDKNLRIIKSYDNDKVNNIIVKLLSIGEYINGKIIKSEVKTLNDLRLIYHKLNSIKTVFTDDLLNISISHIFSYICDSSDYEIKSCMNFTYTDKDYNDDIKKLDEIEKYVKSLI